MARNSISIKGINELQTKLTRNASLNEVKNIVKVNGAELNANAARKAPVDTGFLRRSIVFEIANLGLSARSVALAEYAPYLEWGTRFMSAQPFMGPAFRQQSKKFKSDLTRLVK